MGGTKNHNFSTFFSEGQFLTQLERVDVESNENKMTIGIPKEITIEEKRIPLVPHSISSLVSYGHKVVIESGAGLGAHFTDEDFEKAGAKITLDTKEVYQSSIIVKTAPITLSEVKMMNTDQILISPLNFPLMSNDILTQLMNKKVTALALEYIKNENGSYPILKMMSQIAGKLAVITGMQMLCNDQGGRGILLGGVAGVPPAKIVILGSGVAAQSATETALALGASIRIFDNNMENIMRLQKSVGVNLHTSSINPVYLGYQLTSADIVIAAKHTKMGRSPILVTNEMVKTMKPRSIIIDLSIDQGGCIESSKITTHQKPTFEYEDVIHYCVPNIASRVARTSSIAISNILVNIVVDIGKYCHDMRNYLYTNQVLRSSVYTYNGFVTNRHLGKYFEKKYTPLHLVLASNQ